ncbi:hypothetical protein KDL01_23530 [Actinospica durhamensis]|uniref:Uncharacterized protein n=1 Tax=Actinospica durhamensis TaxID=1508375 RepID=A0A941EYD8_9ACTN|nr:hypothetical protein [Actinospica durhamensis]MBR7836269.1 hypothetical protein [Actinospica durhamensis]
MNALMSPLLSQPILLTPADGKDPAATAATAAEVRAIVGLAHARGARSLTIGSGRLPHATAAAHAIAAAWQAAGGTVTGTITWPESAASWLRQAVAFTRDDPDLWVMAGPVLGWAQMTRRLLWSTNWRPERTLATAAIGRRAALDLVGVLNLPGFSGATAAGEMWTVTQEMR